MFKCKQKITGQTGNDGTGDVEIMAPLEYLYMPLINCENSLLLNWSKKYFLVAGTAANQDLTFTITRAELYVPVVTL